MSIRKPEIKVSYLLPLKHVSTFQNKSLVTFTTTKRTNLNNKINILLKIYLP